MSVYMEWNYEIASLVSWLLYLYMYMYDKSHPALLVMRRYACHCLYQRHLDPDLYWPFFCISFQSCVTVFKFVTELQDTTH